MRQGRSTTSDMLEEACPVDDPSKFQMGMLCRRILSRTTVEVQENAGNGSHNMEDPDLEAYADMFTKVEARVLVLVLIRSSYDMILILERTSLWRSIQMYSRQTFFDIGEGLM